MSDFKNIFSDYTPQRAVSWFAAKILINTIIKENKTKKISDQRETSNAFRNIWTDLRKTSKNNKEIWIDYLADTGDGFNETLTVMYKCIHQIDLEGQILQPGNLLICGGDQVYPFATSQDYENRFFGPLMTAQTLNPKNENISKKDQYRHIFALPGNHDWYGGLYAFQEYFCSNRKYDDYLSKQPKSYHAIRVTDRVWIWMLDIQLSEDFNAAQIRYFLELCTETKNLPRKNEHWQIILCIAQPFWFQKAVDKEDKLFTVVDNFITQIFINQNPTSLLKGQNVKRFLELKLILTGDIHHYTRFNIKYHDLINKVDDSQYKDKNPIAVPLPLITAGGGGAYTYPTHHLEDKVRNRAFQSKINNQTINLVHYYPDASSSIKERHKCLWNIVLKNPSYVYFPLIFYSLCFILFCGYYLPFTPNTASCVIEGDIYLFCTFILGSILFCYLLGSSLDKYFRYMPTYHFYPWLSMAFFFGLIYLCLFLLGVLIQNTWIEMVSPNTFLYTIFFYLMLIFISYLNTLFLGLYIYLSNVFFKIHDNEVFAISKVNKFKNFLKIKIDKKKIAIYPIGIKQTNQTLKKSFKNNDFDKLKRDLDNTTVEMIEPVICIPLTS